MIDRSRIARACAAILVTLLVTFAFAGGAPAHAQTDPAAAAWEAGDTDRAATLYEARLAVDSTDAQALHRLALIRAWSERYDDSLVLFDRLLRVEPRNLDARVDRARVFAWRGQTARALTAIDSVLVLDPASVTALQARAQFASWAGEYASALQTYDRILTVAPQDEGVQYDRARVLAWASRYGEAQGVYEALLRENPDDVQALIGLAMVHVWAGRTDDAVALYDRVLATDPSNIEALRGRARAAAWSGDLRDAERRWRQAIETAPEDGESFAGLAQTLRWQGRDAAAAEVAHAALELDPANAGAREQLRWTDIAMNPRTSPGYTYERDSDGNRIGTLSLGGGWRPAPRTELRLDGYLREARVVGDAAPTLSQQAYGATLTAWRQFEPGWAVSAGIGAATSDLDDSRVTPSFTASVSSPARNPIVASLGFARSALDGTALLVRREVTTSEASATVTTTLPAAVRLRANASVASFDGRVSGEQNTRIAGGVALSRRLRAPLMLAVQARAFTFSRDDIFDGYFAPDFYGIAEASLQYARESGAWGYSLEAAPGVQQVRTDGDLTGTIRVAGSLQYSLRPGRVIALTATTASAGVQSLSPSAAAGYRYQSIGLTTRWTF